MGRERPSQYESAGLSGCGGVSRGEWVGGTTDREQRTANWYIVTGNLHIITSQGSVNLGFIDILWKFSSSYERSTAGQQDWYPD